MAKLGNTTMTAGSCSESFNVNTSSDSYISNVKLDCKGRVRCSGVEIGDDANQLTITDTSGDTISIEREKAILVADGSVKDIDSLLPAKGDEITPVFIGNPNENGASGLQECDIYASKDTNNQFVNQGIVVSQGLKVPLPTTMVFYDDTGNQHGSINLTKTSNTPIEYIWEFKAPSTSDVPKVLCSGGFFQQSDKRLKENFRELDLNKCYEMIDKCQTILFDYKEGAKDQMGMIALEVEEFFPEIVSINSDGYKSLDYAKLTVIILKVLKDLIIKTNVHTNS